MRALRPTAAIVAAAVWNRLRPPSGLRDCILCYHSVHPDRPFRTCRPADFRVHLDWLAEHCEVVPPLGLLQPRKQGLTRPRVAITFDDGYLDNYEQAFPLLRERGLPATFFVTAGLIERDPVVMARFELLRRLDAAALEPMSWAHLREMAAGGMEIGCHTWSHPSLWHLGEDDVERELLRSRSVLEDRLGAAVAGLAYPFGKPRCTYGPREARLAEDLGYSYAVTTVQRGLAREDSPWELPRLSAGRDGKPPLAEKIAGKLDAVGFYNEHAPVWLARALSPRGFRASTYGGSYDELRAGLVDRRRIP